MAEIDFASEHQLRVWLKDKSRAFAAVIATRAMLRVSPPLRRDIIFSEEPPTYEQYPQILLPEFRGIAASWLSARNPKPNDSRRAISEDAARVYFIDNINNFVSGNSTNDGNEIVGINTVSFEYGHLHSALMLAITMTATHDEGSAKHVAVSSVSAAVRAASHADSRGLLLWTAVTDDARRLVGADGRMPTSPETLAGSPLWPAEVFPLGPPDPIRSGISGLSNDLRAAGDDWDVWADWYAARLQGGPAFGLPEAAALRVEEGIVLLPEETWKAGPAAVNAAIKALIAKERAGPGEGARPATLEQLAAIASPQVIVRDGKLDATPNTIFDRPIVDDDLTTLPIRQLRMAELILESLPPQAPRQLKKAIEGYADELRVRGVQPIIGLLRDYVAIIEADLTAAGARDEWLEAGMVAGFKRFEANHATIMDHFPLDRERETIYAATPVDEDAAVGDALIKPFKNIDDAIIELAELGVATENLLKVSGSQLEHARVLASLPPSSNLQIKAPSSLAKHNAADAFPVITADSRPVPPVSAKKRKILSGLGTLLTAKNALETFKMGGTILSYVESKKISDIIAKIMDEINNLIRFIY